MLVAVRELELRGRERATADGATGARPPGHGFHRVHAAALLAGRAGARPTSPPPARSRELVTVCVREKVLTREFAIIATDHYPW
ncbi:hypothetical protein GCM10023200_51870 [Actinomycetospora chlora]|uniref:Uncharacterized protein n=1 Tax=Actinomycetospora chlora TaxID=663608 RepID=A0ABP9CE34_9PSEU